MNRIEGFPPIATASAHTLILGSMPSRESLARHRYYAHPRNAFWPILTELLNLEGQDYVARVREIQEMGYAIWDVLRACERRGSLDANIDEASQQVNDFGGFFTDHPAIGRIFFNGAKAEAVYRKKVLPDLPAAAAALPLNRLPSTSPAHAGMSRAAKTEAWRAILPLQ